MFFRKIRSHEEGNREGEVLQLEGIPKLGEKWPQNVGMDTGLDGVHRQNGMLGDESTENQQREVGT